jgi:hypothetical protein
MVRALSIQVQPARCPELDMDRLSAAFADVLISGLVAHHSFSHGSDKGPYFNFTFGTADAAALWKLIRARFYESDEFGVQMRKASMAMCSSEHGWDDYALLYHFDPAVETDPGPAG